jgi:hypothetical protein
MIRALGINRSISDLIGRYSDMAQKGLLPAITPTDPHVCISSVPFAGLWSQRGEGDRDDQGGGGGMDPFFSTHRRLIEIYYGQ